jgi:hypothetical protein
LLDPQTQLQPEQQIEQPTDVSTAPYVPVVPGDARKGEAAMPLRRDVSLPVRPHDVGQVFDPDETQLRPDEDDMIRDEKGRLRSAHAPDLAGGWRNWNKAKAPEPQIRSVFDETAKPEQPARPDLFDEVTGEAPQVDEASVVTGEAPEALEVPQVIDEKLIVTHEAPEVASPDTHHITVHDLAATATAQHVTIAQPTQSKGTVYRGEPVTAPGAVYGTPRTPEADSLDYVGAHRSRE